MSGRSFRGAGNQRSRRSDAGRTVGVLDIGSTKIMCLIGQVLAGDGQPTVHVQGTGVQRSQGIKSGIVVDMQAAEDCIRSAVAQAERGADVTLADVVVSIACGRLTSVSFAAHADIGPRGVSGADIARLTTGAQAYAEREGRALVHMNRKLFRLDGTPVGDDPRGMAARRLSADIHAVTADEGAMANLSYLVERCHLNVSGLVAAPYASALAVTDADERALGVTVVDMGAGTTTAAVFREGQFVHCTVLPTGGNHLTFDIAQKLHAPLAEAERIKTLYASMICAPSDMGDRFSYRLVGETDGCVQQTSRAHLATVIRPRVETLWRELADRFDGAGYGVGRIVLTGGASQLVGMAEFTSQILAREVHLGQAKGGPDGATAVHNAAGATALGLMLAAPDDDGAVVGHDGGYLSRVGRWFAGAF